METISIKDENGKEYKFNKPNFECELYSVKGDTIIGAYNYDLGLDSWIPVRWSLDGSSSFADNIELTPYIKWWEQEDNFPLVIKFDDDFYTAYGISKNGKYLYDGSSDIITEIPGLFRPATKEEILSLYKEV